MDLWELLYNPRRMLEREDGRRVKVLSSWHVPVPKCSTLQCWVLGEKQFLECQFLLRSRIEP
jgi:hypothetical protein